MGRHAASTTLLMARTVDNAGGLRGAHARTPHPAHARALLEIFSSIVPDAGDAAIIFTRCFRHITIQTYFRYTRKWPRSGMTRWH